MGKDKSGQPRPLISTLEPGIPFHSVFVDQESKFIVVIPGLETHGFLLNGAAEPIRLLPNASVLQLFRRGNAEHLLVLGFYQGVAVYDLSKNALELNVGAAKSGTSLGTTKNGKYVVYLFVEEVPRSCHVWDTESFKDVWVIPCDGSGVQFSSDDSEFGWGTREGSTWFRISDGKTVSRADPPPPTPEKNRAENSSGRPVPLTGAARKARAILERTTCSGGHFLFPGEFCRRRGVL